MHRCATRSTDIVPTSLSRSHSLCFSSPHRRRQQAIEKQSSETLIMSMMTANLYSMFSHASESLRRAEITNKSRAAGTGR